METISKLYDIKIGKDFLTRTQAPIVQYMVARTDNGILPHQRFCSVKDVVNWKDIYPLEWKKIFFSAIHFKSNNYLEYMKSSKIPNTKRKYQKIFVGKLNWNISRINGPWYLFQETYKLEAYRDPIKSSHEWPGLKIWTNLVENQNSVPNTYIIYFTIV